jgi:hypothetical protein
VLDSAVTQPNKLEGPIVVEGYWNGDDPVDRIAFSRVRAILVGQYLENHFHIDSGNIGIVSMKNSPPGWAWSPNVGWHLHRHPA